MSLARVLLVAAVAATTLIAPPVLARDKIVVGLTDSMNPNYASYFYGEKLGFWRDANLTPEFVVLRGSAVMIPQLANKQVHVSSVTPELLIAAAARKEPFPVRLVYNNLRRSLWEFGVMDNSPIRTLADLKGRTLGVGALTWGNLPTTRLILANAGVTWQQDVKINPTGMGPAAWRQLQTGGVDALNLQVWELQAARLAGTNVRFLPVPPQFREVIHNGFAVHNDFIAAPDLINRWGKAYTQSIVACAANRKACLEAFLEANPDQRPPNAEAVEKWLQQQVELAETYWKIVELGTNEPQEWGRYPPGSVERLIKLMHEGGQIPTGDIDPASIYTNALVGGFNAVDLAAARRKALGR
jgi:NitT/TauT family transport system substrate-binding protein